MLSIQRKIRNFIFTNEKRVQAADILLNKLLDKKSLLEKLSFKRKIYFDLIRSAVIVFFSLISCFYYLGGSFILLLKNYAKKLPLEPQRIF